MGCDRHYIAERGREWERKRERERGRERKTKREREMGRIAQLRIPHYKFPITNTND
jgi:hypothetical protein